MLPVGAAERSPPSAGRRARRPPICAPRRLQRAPGARSAPPGAPCARPRRPGRLGLAWDTGELQGARRRRVLAIRGANGTQGVQQVAG